MAITVAQLLPALESGGVEQGALEVAKELVRCGHRSLVISSGGRLTEQLITGGSEHIPWSIGAKSPLTLRFVPRLRTLLRREKVDVLHARSRLPAWIAYLAWRGMDPDNRPLFVTTVHGFYAANRYSAVMVRGEQVIAVSPAIKDYILDHYSWVETGRIRVIPRGIDRSRFSYRYAPDPSWLKHWQHDQPQCQDKLLITLPGRITRLKGHHDFITLIEQLLEQGLTVHGLIVGGKDPRHQAYWQELNTRITTLGLSGAISFLGRRDDLREIMSISDIVMSLSSKPESFGRTVLESLSMGTPVVGYGYGGVKDILNALFPEGIITPGDTHAAIHKVTAFLKKPTVVPESSEFSLTSMLRGTLDLYEGRP